MDKQQIIHEIQRTASENGGVALGQARFEKETGIPKYYWRGKYWRSWGDALKEAGLTENLASKAHERSFLISSLVELTRKNKRFPTDADMTLEKAITKTFPNRESIHRLGKLNERIEFVRQYAVNNPEYGAILAFLPESRPEEDSISNDSIESAKQGYVYMGLLKLGSGKRYKIGKAVLVERRHNQLSLQLPEDLELIHSIRTDDAYGIEAYWHKRFADKRTKGEWFDLSRDDVQAFKKRPA